MAITLLQIDAFTDRPFAGNPAAVALLPEAATPQWMQSVAAEMNLAETAFLVRTGDGRYGLRWFSPQVEIPLCGHATLASAHALWTEGLDASPELRFDTMSGELAARRVEGDLIELDFPARSTGEAALPDGLVDALGVTAVRTGVAEDGYQVVEVATPAEVRSMSPDLAAVEPLSPHAVIVTAAGEPGGPAIVSRVFGPAVGIPEDPVTGSAHCVLATWWSSRAGTSFLAEQASPRGGFLHVTLDGDRVRLRGSAVTVLRGELTA